MRSTSIAMCCLAILARRSLMKAISPILPSSMRWFLRSPTAYSRWRHCSPSPGQRNRRSVTRTRAFGGVRTNVTAWQRREGPRPESQRRHARESADPGGAHRRRVHRARHHDSSPTGHHHSSDHRAVTPATSAKPRTGSALARLVRTERASRSSLARARDRWLVLVSEVMLHQTQAPRVALVTTRSWRSSPRRPRPRPRAPAT